MSQSQPQGTVLVVDSNPHLSNQQYLMSLMQLRTLTRSLEILVECKIANQISSIEAIDVSTLAKRLEYNEPNLRRLLSFAASHGILKELEDGAFIGTG